MNKVAREMTNWVAKNPWTMYVFVFLLWLGSFLSRLKYNGLIFGFDYGLFHPDGALYSFRALLWSGYSKVEAGQLVSDWYAANSFKSKPEGPSLYYENNAFTWNAYSSRILYPLLSVPFVKLFGVAGMLVVPSTTFLAVLLISCNIALRLGHPLVGVFAVIAITLSTSVQRWMFSNITDGLLLLFTSLFTLLMFRRESLLLVKRDLFYLFLIIVGSSLTRFSAFIWFAVALVFFLHKRYIHSALTVTITVLSHLPIFLKPFSGYVLPGYGNKSLMEKVFIYPYNLVKVTIFELGQLYVLDRSFFFLLLVVIALAIANRKRLSAQFFLIILIAVWLTGAINGVLGVNFRYQIPVVPLLLWALIDLLPRHFSSLQKYLNEKSLRNQEL